MSEVFGVVEVQEVAVGGSVDGSVPDGTLQEAFSGRYKKYLGCSVGGGFVVHPYQGKTVKYVTWNLPGATQVGIYLKDEDGVEYLIDSVAAVSGSRVFTSDMIFVPPGWLFEIKIDAGSLTSDGRVMATFDSGWGIGTLDQQAGLLVESGSRVPEP